MEPNEAIDVLGGLAQTTRLEAFRLLIRHAPDGLAAGDIAQHLLVPTNTMSAHLAVLSRAGLVSAQRNGRSIQYRADVEQVRALVLFLIADCCGGRADLCEPMLADLLPLCVKDPPMDVVIYHNPACGTSRNTLALIRHAGIEPRVVEYLKTPPDHEGIRDLVARMGISLRDVLREKGTPFAQLDLGDPNLDDNALLDAIAAHPVLLNRPIVATPLGVKLCRPSEVVLDLLPDTPLASFTKEDGEVVIDADGRRVGR